MARDVIDGRGSRKVTMACSGAERVALADLHELQGNLKSLSDERFDQLKREILRDGFSFAVHAWRDPNGKVWILDGHQRTRVLRQIEADGYAVPPVPISLTEADSLEQAKQKLLAAASQYGQMERQGLYEFYQDVGLTPDDLIDRYSFPEIDLPDFKADFFDASEREPATGATEIGEGQFSTMLHQCPKCGFSFGKGKD